MKSSHSLEHKEATHDEASDKDSDDDEMAFIIKIFKYLGNKNKRLFGKKYSFKGKISRDKDDKKCCFNCQKHDHFIGDCLDLQNDKAKKENFQKNNFRSKFKKILMATWDKLDDKEEADKSKEEANLALVSSTFSNSESKVGSDSDLEDMGEVFSKLSKFNLITICQDLMERCQQKSKHMKIIKNQYGLIRD